MSLETESGIGLNDGWRIPRLALGTFDIADGDEATAIDALDKEAPVIEGIDPQNFAPYLNGLSSHF